MKIIEKNNVLESDFYLPTIFFTDNSVIVNKHTLSPIITLEFSKKLRLKIHRIYKDESLILVRVDSLIHHKQLSDADLEFYPIKAFLSLPTAEKFRKLILKAVQWMEWDLTVRYCHSCGNKLAHSVVDMRKRCNHCHIALSPMFSPAVLVLVTHNNRILLARSPHFKPKVYSAIAGFINPGETAEEAAVREVKEEVGLTIGKLTYFGTQTWPFPDRFMIAFTAEYLSGELCIDKQELEDAQWFNIHDLPKLPYSSSLSKKLIDSFIAEMLNSTEEKKPE